MLVMDSRLKIELLLNMCSCFVFHLDPDDEDGSHIKDGEEMVLILYYFWIDFEVTCERDYFQCTM